MISVTVAVKLVCFGPLLGTYEMRECAGCAEMSAGFVFGQSFCKQSGLLLQLEQLAMA
jgi:hypothetical protein